jgi:hypothetical protein
VNCGELWRTAVSMDAVVLRCWRMGLDHEVECQAKMGLVAFPCSFEVDGFLAWKKM